MYVYIYIYMYMYLYMCIIYMYVCVYIYIYICIHTHLYLYLKALCATEDFRGPVFRHCLAVLGNLTCNAAVGVLDSELHK